jgi:hypothetical protein
MVLTMTAGYCALLSGLAWYTVMDTAQACHAGEVELSPRKITWMAELAYDSAAFVDTISIRNKESFVLSYKDTMLRRSNDDASTEFVIFSGVSGKTLLPANAADKVMVGPVGGLPSGTYRASYRVQTEHESSASCDTNGYYWVELELTVVDPGALNLQVLPPRVNTYHVGDTARVDTAWVINHGSVRTCFTSDILKTGSSNAFTLISTGRICVDPGDRVPVLLKAATSPITTVGCYADTLMIYYGTASTWTMAEYTVTNGGKNGTPELTVVPDRYELTVELGYNPTYFADTIMVTNNDAARGKIKVTMEAYYPDTMPSAFVLVNPIDTQTTNLSVGQSKKITVRPAAGLGIGNYEAHVKIWVWDMASNPTACNGTSTPGGKPYGYYYAHLILNVVDSASLCGMQLLPPRVNSYVLAKDTARIDTAWLVSDNAIDNVTYQLSLLPTNGKPNAFELVNPADTSGTINKGERKAILLKAVLSADTGHYADTLTFTTGGRCNTSSWTLGEYTIIDSTTNTLKLRVTPKIIYWEIEEG